MYIAGIDLGTSAAKTAVYDLSGNIVAECTKGYALSQPQNGWAEQNPYDWWDAVCDTIKQIALRIEVSKIISIGFAGQMHGLVMLDEENQVIRPAILWCDGRSAEECAEINETIGIGRLLQITASPALPGFTASKIRWVQKHEPENYAKCRHILLPKDYIRFCLSGDYYTDTSDASGMQLLDLHTRNWSKEICSKLGIERSLLAAVRESVEAAGTVSGKAAAVTGLKSGTVLAAGAGDNAAAAVGTGVICDGQAFTTIGTSGVVFAHTQKLAADRAARIHTFCSAVPGEYHIMGVTQAAGLSLQWFRKNFAAEKSYAELDRMAALLPVGAARLIYLPYLMGERTPHLDPRCRGVFFGLSAMHETAHLYRAVLEGVSFALLDAYEIVRAAGPAIERMFICGGGAKSRMWREMISDIFGIEITDMSRGGGAALGAAILGGVAGGAYRDLFAACRQTVKYGSVSAPDTDRHQAYRSYVKLYRSIYLSLTENFNLLASL